MAATDICPQCGTVVPGHTAVWLCPKCLLGQAATPAPELPLSSAPHASPTAPSILHYFGDYELLHEIARGGMGVVYKAKQVSLNRIVAVKMLLFGKLAGEDFVKRFRAEAEAAASLQHPNIVAIHEVGEHDGQHYFSMDYVEGSNLAALVLEKPLPARRAATYLKIVAEAIHYAHQRGVLHRDLKPSNILIDAHEQPRVTDFGLAKRLPNSATGTENLNLTLTGQVLGTPHYMPPEQADGKGVEATPASDVYSLGAIFYHLLTGRPPFLAATLESALAQLLHNEPVPPRLLNASVPRNLETICLKCLSKEPSRRYASAGALAQELGRWLNGDPILARPAGLPERLWRWGQRRPVVAGLIVSLHLVLVLGFSGILWQWRRAEHNAHTAANQSQRAKQHANAEAAQRARAEAQAKKSQQVSRFLAEMLQGVQPEVALGRDTTVLREILSQTEKRLRSELKDQPEVEAELRHTIGVAYLSLGDPINAESILREALRLRRAVLGDEHDDTLDSQFRLAHALRDLGRREEFTALIHQTLDLHLRLHGENDARTVDLLNTMADGGMPTLTEAEALHRRAWAILERMGATNDFLLPYTLEGLAQNLRLQERLAEAEAIARESVAAHRRILGESQPVTARVQCQFAGLLRELGKFDEADRIVRESWDFLHKVYGDTDPVAIRALLELAEIQFDRRDRAAAEPLLQRVFDVATNWTNQVFSSVGRAVMAELGFRLSEETRQHWDQGRPVRARECALRAERVLRPLLATGGANVAPTDWMVLWTRSLLGGALIAVATTDLEIPLPARLAKFAEAETLLLDVFGKFKARPFPDPVTAYHNLAPTQERLVALYLRWHDVEPTAEHAAKLAEWRQRLDELERNAGRKPGRRMSERYTPE